MNTSKTQPLQCTLKRLYGSSSRKRTPVGTICQEIVMPNRVVVQEGRGSPRRETKLSETILHKQQRKKKILRCVATCADDNSDMAQPISTVNWPFARPSRYYQSYNASRDDKENQSSADNKSSKKLTTRIVSNILSSNSRFINLFLSMKMKSVKIERRDNYLSFLKKSIQK